MESIVDNTIDAKKFILLRIAWLFLVKLSYSFSICNNITTTIFWSANIGFTVTIQKQEDASCKSMLIIS